MSNNTFARMINEERTHFLELWYDEWDENPLRYACCSVDIQDNRHGGCWVGSDYNWDDYKGVRDKCADLDDSYHKNLKQIIRKGGVVLPVYCYEHSGITFKCSSFSDPWDSGQVGYAYMTTEQITELGFPKGKRRKAVAEEYIRHMVGSMAAYANGDIYGFTIYDKNGEVMDSCGGFYTSHYAEKDDWLEQMKDNAPEEFHPLFDEYYPRRLDDVDYCKRIPSVA